MFNPRLIASHTEIGGLAEQFFNDVFRIVIVDDEQMYLDQYASIFSDMPPIVKKDIKTFNSSASAVNGLSAMIGEEHLPHLIIIDLHLGEFKGMDIARLLRDKDFLPNNQNITIVLISNDAAHKEIINEAASLNCVLIDKSISPQKLELQFQQLFRDALFSFIEKNRNQKMLYNLKEDLRMSAHGIKNNLSTVRLITEQCWGKLKDAVFDIGKSISVEQLAGITENLGHIERAMTIALIMGQNACDGIQSAIEQSIENVPPADRMLILESIIKKINHNIHPQLAARHIEWKGLAKAEDLQPLRYAFLFSVYPESVLVWLVFSNVIENSADALQRHLVSDPWISLTVSTESPYHVFTITDNGPGFAPDILAKIYQEPVFSTKNATEKRFGEGTIGAGNIVRACGGKIVASNSPSGGAITKIYLPSTSPESLLTKNNLKPLQNDPLGKIAEIRRTKKILLIDDNAEFIGLLKNAFADDGFEQLQTAVEPDEALQKMIEISPDLITLDMEMGADAFAGLSLIQRMIEQNIITIPIIIISGSSAEDKKSIRESLRALAATFVIGIIDKQSCDPGNLPSRVAELLLKK